MVTVESTPYQERVNCLLWALSRSDRPAAAGPRHCRPEMDTNTHVLPGMGGVAASALEALF
jgi:hypothetical protein